MEKIQDVLKAAANAYKLLMENEKVRVLDILLKPGEKAPMHNHPSYLSALLLVFSAVGS